MHRLSRLLLAFVVSVGGVMAGTITFDDATAGLPGTAYPTAIDAGITVNFFVAANGSTTPTGPAFGAVRGGLRLHLSRMTIPRALIPRKIQVF